MILRIRLLLAAMAAAALVAGCNGSAATSTPASTPSPTPAAVGSPGSFSIPGLSLHAAPDLETMLPDSIAGTPLLKFSFSLAQVSALAGSGVGGDMGFQTFTSWIQALGKNPNDVNMAIATSLSTSGVTVGAVRVNGANSQQLVSSFVQAATASAGLSAAETTVGGKSVVKVSDQVSSARYVYAKNDVLFFAEAPDDATASAALAALP